MVSEKELKEIVKKEEEKIEKPKKLRFSEEDLHPFLTYYAYYFLNVFTKTLRHQKSYKRKYAQWLHPDMVGVYFPAWEEEVKNFSKEIGMPTIKLYSFEIKKELSFSNLREAFFQAVSNSSWANEGYLVAAEIDEDEDFRLELKRLST